METVKMPWISSNRSDVIVSSNEMRNFHLTHWPSSGAAGEAIVFNDDTPSNRKWAVNNVIHDCNIGVRSQSIGDNYVVGNVFFNIYHDPSKPLPTSPGHTSGVCVALFAFDSFHVVNNTFDDVDGGVYVNNGNVMTIENNMFGSLKVPTIIVASTIEQYRCPNLSFGQQQFLS